MNKVSNYSSVLTTEIQKLSKLMNDTKTLINKSNLVLTLKTFRHLILTSNKKQLKDPELVLIGAQAAAVSKAKTLFTERSKNTSANLLSSKCVYYHKHGHVARV